DDDAEGQNQDRFDGVDDPLGLGLWMSHFIKAIGRGIVHVVVMVGMGGFANWIYGRYLENTPLRIGSYGS
ncbi:hypothetical protein BGZ65_003256, partial [Modicella reniformis]